MFKRRDKLIETIYEKYQNFMYCIAYRVVKDCNFAEDIVHESMIKIIKNIDMFKKIKDGKKLKNFIAIVVVNTSRDELKKNSNIVHSLTEELSLDTMDESISVEKIVISNDTILSISNEIDKLDEKYSSVLKLKLFHDFSIKEISDILEINEESTRKRYTRGRNFIISKLRKERDCYGK